MSEIEKSRLDELAEEINHEHASFRRAFKSTYRSALRAGDLLNEAKAEVPHGGWSRWVEENCEFSMRTAQVYMRIANHREEVEATLKSAEPAYLSIEGVLTRIASPNAQLTRARAEGELTWAHSVVPESGPVPVTGATPTVEVREPGAIELLQASPEGVKALAEINRDFQDGQTRDRVRKKISELRWLLPEVSPADVAKDVVADFVSDRARDAVLDRSKTYGPGDIDVENARDVHAWLQEYLQVLQEAEAHLRTLATTNSSEVSEVPWWMDLSDDELRTEIRRHRERARRHVREYEKHEIKPPRNLQRESRQLSREADEMGAELRRRRQAAAG